MDMCINQICTRTSGRCGPWTAIFGQGCVGSRCWEERRDKVLLRATVVIVVRRRVKMTSALPDKEERKMMLHRKFEEAERVQIG